MKSWKRNSLILITAVFFLLMSGVSALAQNVDPDARSIRGSVYLDVNADGNIDLDPLAAAIRPDTVLVSIMWANNETGVIQPMEEVYFQH